MDCRRIQHMITQLEDKIGGRNKLDQETKNFKEFINNASLIDQQFYNGKYTWSNRRTGKHHIASKLDRFLVSDNWIRIGRDITTAILPHSGSDHWPISLQWQRPSNVTGRPFWFEGFWLTHPNFRDFSHSTWKAFTPPEGSKMYQFQQKIKNLKYHLKRHTEATVEEEQSIHTQLEERRKQEEILWKQKSRIRWLKEGERNTKFFHRTTVQRRTHNNIPFLQKQDGTRIEQHEEIEKEFLTHFKEVHQEQNTDRGPAIDKIIQHVPKLITGEHNELLLKPISTQEVDSAMSQLKEGKDPGPDGFTTTFFHSFWDMIKTEVWEVVEESRALHWLLPSLNSTFLALIPKEEESIALDKFRPIPLCNVIYKVISKVIANRLKALLPMLISPEQSGYVEGRQILDGIILTHEIIHSLKQTRQPGMIPKLDLSKAGHTFKKCSLLLASPTCGFDGL
eukprot:PITA_18973